MSFAAFTDRDRHLSTEFFESLEEEIFFLIDLAVFIEIPVHIHRGFISFRHRDSRLTLSTQRSIILSVWCASTNTETRFTNHTRRIRSIRQISHGGLLRIFSPLIQEQHRDLPVSEHTSHC